MNHLARLHAEVLGEPRLEPAAVHMPAFTVRIGQEGALARIGGAPEGPVSLRAEMAVGFQAVLETEVPQEGEDLGERQTQSVRERGTGSFNLTRAGCPCD